MSCQDKQGKEIYWHVVEEEIYGTSEATKASEFFIKYLQKEAPQFCIMHKNSSDADFFARFTDKQGSDCLRLVRTATTPDISFVLKSSTKEARNLPAAPTGWAKEGPFFIRKFSDSGSIRWILEKLGFISVPYVGMTKCEEESKSEYRTVRRYKIDDENAHLMMFTMSYQVIKAGDMSCAQDASTAGASYERYAPCLQSASTSTSRAGKEYLALRALDTSGSSVLSSVWGGVGTLVGYLVGLRQQSHVSRASEFSAIVGSPYYSFPQSVTAAGLSSNALRAIQ